MGCFSRALWRIATGHRLPDPRLKHNAETSGVLSNFFPPCEHVGLKLGGPVTELSVEKQVCSDNLASPTDSSCVAANLLTGGRHPGLREVPHQLRCHTFHTHAELLYKASSPTPASIRNRPRRPMKPLSDLLNPPTTPVQAEQTPKATPSQIPKDTPPKSKQKPKEPAAPTAPNPPPPKANPPLPKGNPPPPKAAPPIKQAAPAASIRPPPNPTPPPREPGQPQPKRFGVVSPQELPPGAAWIGNALEENGNSGGQPQPKRFGVVSPQELPPSADWIEIASEENRKSGTGTRDRRDQDKGERSGVEEDLDSVSRQSTEQANRAEPSGSRVSFGQLLRSRNVPRPDRERVPAPVLDEDVQSLESSPPPVENYTRPVPSWKVGLANREQKQAKVAAKDVEQKLNEAITAQTVRLVSVDGKSHEIVSIQEALDRATKAGLDLLEVNATADPPICKLVDYKKFKFVAKKKEKEKKKQELEQRRERMVKEIRLSSRTDYRDMEMKARAAKEHLALGYQVRCFVQFKKGDRRADVGIKLLPEMLELLKDHGTVNTPPRQVSGRMEMYLRPLSIGDRKKLPEYKKQAGDGAEQVAAPKKKATSKERVAAASGNDGEELSSSESDEVVEEWTGGAGDSEPEEWADEELDSSEGDALSGEAHDGDRGMEEGAADLDPPVLDKTELDEDDEVPSDLGEAAKHVPKKKRWADRLRHPLRPKRARKRRNAIDDDDDSGSDSGSDDDRSRSSSDDDKSGSDTDEDSSESDSDDEDERDTRRR